MKTYLGDAGTQAAFSYGELSPEYLTAVDQVAPGIVTQAERIQIPGESFIDSLSRAITTLAMADAQRQLLKVQIQRASQGLPPLNTSQYGVGANVNLGVSSDTQRMLLIGAGILAAAFVLPKLLKG